MDILLKPPQPLMGLFFEFLPNIVANYVYVHCSTFISTGRYGTFKLPAKPEGFHVWKVEAGILMRYQDATENGKTAIGKMIQQGHGKYMGIEITPGSKNDTCKDLCNLQVAVDAESTIIPNMPKENATVKTFDVRGR